MEKYCNSCGNDAVPYIVHESAMARNERTQRRLWILVIILIAAILLSNLAWIIYESQFDTYSYEQDGNGINNINSGSQGDLINEPAFENQEEEKW